MDYNITRSLLGSLKGEIITGLKAIKAAFTECGGEHNIPISLDMVKVADKSYGLYKEQ